MKAVFLEGKEVGQVFIHPRHVRAIKHIKLDSRTWKQKLQFTTFCAKVVDKFWRVKATYVQ